MITNNIGNNFIFISDQISFDDIAKYYHEAEISSKRNIYYNRVINIFNTKN